MFKVEGGHRKYKELVILCGTDIHATEEVTH